VTRRPTRWDLGFAALLVLALALCLVQTVAILRFRDPRPSVVAAVGERVELDGVRLTLDRLVVAPELPARPEQEPVVAMPGARLVAVWLSLEVTDPARDAGQLYCYLTLVDDRDRRWTTDYDIGGRAALPERTGCSATEDRPVTVNQPYAVGAAFTIPADAADRVRLRLELESDQVMVEFRR
jgi:hypothetical protein